MNSVVNFPIEYSFSFFSKIASYLPVKNSLWEQIANIGNLSIQVYSKNYSCTNEKDDLGIVKYDFIRKGRKNKTIERKRD
jgi:hypothetical protein